MSSPTVAEEEEVEVENDDESTTISIANRASLVLPAPNILTQQLIRIDVQRALSWRSKKYFKIRHRLLRQKQSKADKNVYIKWREFLLQKRQQNLFNFSFNPAEKYGVRNLHEIGKQFEIVYPIISVPLPNSTSQTNLAKQQQQQNTKGKHSNSIADNISTLQDDLNSQFEHAHDTPTTEIVDSMWSSNLTTRTHILAKQKVSEAYAFVGMHHIMEHGNGSVAVTRIKFANNETDRIAFAAEDGTITIAAVLSKKEVVHVLKEHTAAVTDFDWSGSNEYIISSSMDKSVKVWDASKGNRIRSITETNLGNAYPTCLLFHPFNSNIFLVGYSNNNLSFYNLSTGKAFSKLKIVNAVKCICFNPVGDRFFVGDAKSCIYIFSFDSLTGQTKQLSKTQIFKNGIPITSISYSSWQSASSVKANPSLLVNVCGSNAVHLFNVTANGGIAFSQNFPIANRQDPVRSVFCPLVSLKNGACFISGSESTEVLVFDLTHPTSGVKKQSIVNRLMGHMASVLDVAWDYQENLLASCDKTGVVILWKRKMLIYELEEEEDAKTEKQQDEDSDAEDLANQVVENNSNKNANKNSDEDDLSEKATSGRSNLDEEEENVNSTADTVIKGSPNKQ